MRLLIANYFVIALVRRKMNPGSNSAHNNKGGDCPPGKGSCYRNGVVTNGMVTNGHIIPHLQIQPDTPVPPGTSHGRVGMAGGPSTPRRGGMCSQQSFTSKLDCVKEEKSGMPRIVPSRQLAQRPQTTAPIQQTSTDPFPKPGPVNNSCGMMNGYNSNVKTGE